ncbi:L-threonylcarbamoyladenylate synthase [Halocola ammonii]
MKSNELKEEVNRSVEVMRNGGVILYPTDTIWGIGCDATNPEAVKKVFEIKQRDDSKSVIVLLENDGHLQRYVKDIPEVAWDIIDLAEKPTTVVFSGAYNLAPQVIAEDGSVGIRITKDDFCRQLIRRLNKPLVSTSANISGEPSPASFAEVSEKIKDSVDYVVDHRQDERGSATPSSVIKIGDGGLVEILRK